MSKRRTYLHNAALLTGSGLVLRALGMGSLLGVSQGSRRPARLLAIEKGSGRIVVDDTRATPNGNYYRIDVSRADRTLDILSHNARMRIQALAPPEEPQQ